MVLKLMHWLSGETKEDRKADEARKQRLEVASKRHTEACQRHDEVYTEATKTAEEVRELTAEASRCFAQHMGSSMQLKPVAGNDGENLP
jgi:hypothetical protein